MSDKSSGAIVPPDLSHNPAHTAQGSTGQGGGGRKRKLFPLSKRWIVDSWIKKGYIDSKNSTVNVGVNEC